MNLKILIQNLHCLVEDNVCEKQEVLANKIFDYDIDIAFFQEVAQTFSTNSNIKIASDNYGLVIKNLLSCKGVEYHYYFVPIKKSFDKFDEGLGILSKFPLKNIDSKYISKTRDYSNWKTRKILIGEMKFDDLEVTFATTHFGWSDGYEVFEDQFDLATTSVNKNNLFILAGDFNVYPESTEYRHILEKGFIDIFKDSREFYYKPTYRGDSDTHFESRRIDYLFTNQPVKLVNQEILFKENRISDHYGVYIEIEI